MSGKINHYRIEVLGGSKPGSRAAPEGSGWRKCGVANNREAAKRTAEGLEAKGYKVRIIEYVP